MPKTRVKGYTKRIKGKRVFIKPYFRHLPVRTAHQLRPVKERIRDERTTEELVTIDRWYKDPDKYDYPRVDVGLPEGFSFKTEHSRYEDDKKYLILVDDKNREVAELAYFEHYNDPEYGKDLLYLAQLQSMEGGKGYSSFLMREMVNKADLENRRIILVVSPSGEKYFIFDEIGVMRLMDYYKQFGFKPLKYSHLPVMLKEPQKEVKKWI